MDDDTATDGNLPLPERAEPDYETPCENCGAVPTVTIIQNGMMVMHIGLCGACCFGDADCLDPANW